MATLMEMDKDALLIGNNDNLGIRIYLDFRHNETIFLKYGSVHTFTRKEFNALLNFLRLAQKHIPTEENPRLEAKMISPRSMSSEGHIWIYEDGTVKVTWHNWKKTLSNTAYHQLIDCMLSAQTELARYDKFAAMSEEARRLLGVDEAGRKTTVRDALYVVRILGYSTAAILFVISLMLSVAAIFSPVLLHIVLIIWLVLIDAYLLLPQSEKLKIRGGRENIREFINEDLLGAAGNLPVGRKTLELFLILGLVFTFMTAYFTRAIPTIMDFGKRLFGGGPVEQVQDVTQMGLRTQTVEVDPRKKIVGFSRAFAILHKVATKYQVSFYKMELTPVELAGFINVRIDAVLMSDNKKRVEDFAEAIMQYHRYFTQKELKDMIEKKYQWRTFITLSQEYNEDVLPAHPRKVSKAQLLGNIKKTLSILKIRFKISQQSLSQREKSKFFIVKIQGLTDNFGNIVEFMRIMDGDTNIVRCLPTRIGMDYNGNYNFNVVIHAIYDEKGGGN